ncbi:MAG: hypothetical protein ACFFD4_30265, partial [Candidatus Odinarchaeota archaeon]
MVAAGIDDGGDIPIDEQRYAFGNWEISLHNKNQFELQMDYRVNPKVARSRYKIETYFFMPSSFRITPVEYTKDKFYEEIKAYIRFRTKLMSFQEIIDTKNDTSPLTRVAVLLSQLFEGDVSESNILNIAYELKMLANVSTNYLANEVSTIINFLKVSRLTSTDQGFFEAEQRIKVLLAGIKSFRRNFLEMEKPITNSLVPKDVKQSYE